MHQLLSSLVHRSTRALGPLAVGLALLGGCALDGPGGVTAPLACDTHSDCPARHACEPEDDGPVCRPHGTATGSGVDCAVDADCPIGEECELEHGASWCQAHGGGGDGGAAGGAACATDADCGAGEECEIEHGSSFCKPHGGGDGI